jgi:hypothetical protein
MKAPLGREGEPLVRFRCSAATRRRLELKSILSRGPGFVESQAIARQTGQAIARRVCTTCMEPRPPKRPDLRNCFTHDIRCPITVRQFIAALRAFPSMVAASGRRCHSYATHRSSSHASALAVWPALVFLAEQPLL